MVKLKIYLIIFLLIGLIGITSATTEYFEPSGNSDGYTVRAATNVSLTSLINGVGTNHEHVLTNTQSAIASDLATNNYSQVVRADFLINTSGLPNNAVVDSANLTVFQSARLFDLGNLYYTVTGVNPTTAGTIETADYQRHYNTRYATDFLTTAGDKSVDIPLNSYALSNISVTGYTNLAIRLANDVDDSLIGITWDIPFGFPGYSRVKWNTSEAALNRPNLTVIYHTVAPIANFTPSATTGVTPSTITFTDTTTFGPATWYWDFGDGTTDTVNQSPSHIYTTPGTFTVSLNASNSDGYNWSNKTALVTIGDGTCDSPTPHTLTVKTTSLHDATVYRGGDEAFTTIRNGAGTTVTDLATSTTNIRVVASATPNQYVVLQKTELIFNASAYGLPSTAIVDSANVKLNFYSKSNGLGGLSVGITKANPVTPGTIAAGDYAVDNDDKLVSDVAYNDISTSAYTTFTGNSLLASNVSVTGLTSLMIRLSNDIDNSDPGWINSAESRYAIYSSDASSSVSPELVITYHLPPSIPVADFEADATSVNQYYSVNFTDKSENDPGCFVWTYKESGGAWTQFSTSENPSFVFPAGTYDINLTATTSSGSDSEIKLGYIVSTGIAKTEPRIYPILSPNNTRILPFNYTQTDPYGATYVFNDGVLGYQGTNLSMNATTNEYESVSFVIKPNDAVSNFTITASALTDGLGHTIPASAIDIRAIKVWYQSAYSDTGYNTMGYYLAPELLLKDDDLIRVNYTSQQQKVRLTTGGVTEYFNIDNTTKGTFPTDAIIYNNGTGSGDLQPFSLPANYNKQIWVTAHIPAAQENGTYTGTISIVSGGTLPKTLNLNIRVLPFSLSNTTLDYGLYYEGIVVSSETSTLSTTQKTEAQYTAELTNMKEHGVLYPMMNQYYYNYSINSYYTVQFEKALQIRNTTGFPTDHIFLRYGLIPPGALIANDSATISALDIQAKEVKNETSYYGFNYIYAYGTDEATDANTYTELAALQNMIDNNVGTSAATNYLTQNLFGIAGTTMLAPIIQSAPGYNAAELAKWKGIANQTHRQVMVYNYPQMCAEDPETYRNHYGFTLLQSGYDGVMDYAYQDQYPNWSLGWSMWNDFDGPETSSSRDHVAAYPVTNGVIDTLQWEAFREASDDSRYAQTVTDLMGTNTTTNTIINTGLAEGVDMSVIRARLISALTTAPTADFTATPTLGNTPLNVQFNDTSTNLPTNWSWYINDNTTAFSTLQNPTSVFTSGEASIRYTIKLNASNSYGFSWMNKTDYLGVYGTSPHSACISDSSTSSVTSALNTIGLMLVIVGTVGILYSLLGAGGLTGGRSNYGGSGDVNMMLIVASILAILIGAVMLVMGYVIIGSAMGMSVACL